MEELNYLDRTSLPPLYTKNGWLKYDHRVMPFYGMWGSGKASWMAQPTKKTI